MLNPWGIQGTFGEQVARGGFPFLFLLLFLFLFLSLFLSLFLFRVRSGYSGIFRIFRNIPDRNK